MNRLKKFQSLVNNTKPPINQAVEATPDHNVNQQQIQIQQQQLQPARGHSSGQQSIVDEDLAEFEKWNPMMDDYISSKNTLTIDNNSDPLTTITGKLQPISSKIGNTTICEHFATYGECADGRFCEKIHIEPQVREKIWALQNTYETNKDRTCMNFTYLSTVDIKPDPNVLLLVSVSGIISPSNFYLVAPFENLNFANLSQADRSFYIDRIQQQSTVKKKLQKYHQQMADIFGHSYRVDNLNDDIYLSQIVACKLKDGHFRRAMVTDLPEYSDLNYKLLLIDVGVEVELPRELIYDIKANILSDPPLALNCRLPLKPAKGALGWSAGALSQFQNSIRRNRFALCKIIDQIKIDRMFTVDLLDYNTKMSFTEMMLSSGLADRC